jgi:hypothetical protein
MRFCERRARGEPPTNYLRALQCNHVRIELNELDGCVLPGSMAAACGVEWGWEYLLKNKHCDHGHIIAAWMGSLLARCGRAGVRRGGVKEKQEKRRRWGGANGSGRWEEGVESER